MREEEKIFAGKLFDARTKQLKNIKRKAQECCKKFNQMNWNLKKMKSIGVY